eukprot:TRINITY_DN14807_c0_g1_i1.p1 TRINITY_DN14807_c0_g1~~TRINITY_DN14807_c0_g1_i1.p1  ORF type:complete len:434 (+),score=112.66 TRINITY_DN14807_c0_g1_i1:185-1486(+)
MGSSLGKTEGSGNGGGSPPKSGGSGSSSPPKRERSSSVASYDDSDMSGDDFSGEEAEVKDTRGRRGSLLSRVSNVLGGASVGSKHGLGSYLVQESNEQEPTLGPKEKALDMVFVSDCTSSMSSYIQSAKDSIVDIVTQIVASEKVNVRFGLVEYRDHPPEDSTFVTRTSHFTSSHRKMKERVDQMKALGGGDGPEAVTDGLHSALNLAWRKEAVKVVVVIADAPPHGLEKSGDHFPRGCPCGHDPLKIAKQMAERGICIYSVLCEPALGSYSFARDFFMAIAKMTGGQYLPLTSANLLPKVIVASALEELSLQEVQKIFEKEAQELKQKGQLTEEALEQRMKERMAEIGPTEETKQVRLTSIYARSYSFTNVCKLERQTSLSSVRDELCDHTEQVYDDEKMRARQSIELDSAPISSSKAQMERCTKKAYYLFA